ncbi:MAG: tetraacyldisaccharide 4'-kinase [Rhodanobacteraceae bacterium]
MFVGDSLQRRWYASEAPLAWWTLPLAGLYGGVTGLRRALYRHGVMRATRLPVPVAVVGNISVGGTGKTPLVIALVEALRARGFKPGVVSRGHGGSARGPMLLDASPDPAIVGDEPALIRLRTGIPVAVGAKRAAAARLLLGEGVEVILADDGLQHYALARDVEICVVDGARGFGNGWLLPAGPLREPRTRLRDVNFVVCNVGEADARAMPTASGKTPNDRCLDAAIAMRVRVGEARSLRSGEARPLARFAATRVHAVAGIGNPARFFAALRAIGVVPVEHAFTDHHHYAVADLDFGDGMPVLMTEKDAVKCRAFAQDGWWSVPVTAVLPESFLDAFTARLNG